MNLELIGGIAAIMGVTIFMEGIIRTKHPLTVGFLFMVFGGALMFL